METVEGENYQDKLRSAASCSIIRYHHQRQLSVYFWLMDIPVSVIYGASADESLFALLARERAR